MWREFPAANDGKWLMDKQCVHVWMDAYDERRADNGRRDACVNGVAVIQMQKAYENLICFLLSRTEGGGRRNGDCEINKICPVLLIVITMENHHNHELSHMP